jgi:hypothetical protein
MIKCQRFVCVLLASFVALSPPLWATDIWVAGTGSDATGTGSSGSPYRTITKAMNEASTNDVIKVLTGDYDVNAGEVFPISIKYGVDIIGQEASVANYPRVGGDVTSSSVAALLVIDGSSGEKEDIVIQNLRLLGQDDEDFDSPSAFMTVGSGVSNCSFINNFCERGEMNNASESDDRPTILIAGGGSSCTIESNAIEVSVRGAVEVRGSSSGTTAVVGLVIYNNAIKNAAGTVGDYGIYWNGADGRALAGNAVIRDNRILAGNQGIRAGVWVDLEDPGGEDTSNFNVSTIEGNSVSGCSGDGMLLSSDGDTNITISPFARNTIRNNGGSGVRVWRDPDANGDGTGYVNMQCQGNLIVDNADNGYRISGLGVESLGNTTFINETIAGNALGGIGFDEWIDPVYRLEPEEFTPLYGPMRNAILWGNNANFSYVQVTGLGDLLSDFIDGTSYTTWQNLSNPEDGNDNTDPKFVNAAAGDYHLDGEEESTAIDGGRLSVEVTATVDIDGEARIQDGDFACSGSPVPVIDRGADEVPEPDCE